jgi:hypothetical protein
MGEPLRPRELVGALDPGVEEDIVGQAGTKGSIKPGCDDAFRKKLLRWESAPAGHWISLAMYVLCKIPLQPGSARLPVLLGMGGA